MELGNGDVELRNDVLEYSPMIMLLGFGALALMNAARFDEGRGRLEHAERLARAHNEPEGLGFALISWCRHAEFTEEAEFALAQPREAVEIGERIGNRLIKVLRAGPARPHDFRVARHKSNGPHDMLFAVGLLAPFT